MTEARRFQLPSIIRHCEERSDEAIQSPTDRFRANDPGLLRSARNDGKGFRIGPALLLALSLAAPAFGADPLPVPQPTADALAYHQGQDLFWLADQALGFLFPAILLFAGWSAGLTRWSRRATGGRWYPTLALYALIYSVIAFDRRTAAELRARLCVRPRL